MENNSGSQSAPSMEVPVQTAPSRSNASSRFDISNIKIKTIGIVLIVLLVIIGSTVVLLKLGAKPTPDPKIIQAQAAINQGNFTDAKRLYSEVLATKKNDPSALSGVITSISLQGNQTGTEKQALAEAQPYIDQSNSQSLNVLIASGYAYETAGNYQKALEYYDKAIKAFPKSSDAWFHEGHALQFLNRNDEAYVDYDKSLALDPNNPSALMVIGNKLLSEGKTEEAFQDYKKASGIYNQTSQSRAESFTAAATVRTDQDNYIHFDEALELSKKAVEADPDFSPALAIYGYDLYLSKKKPEGIEYLKKAINANPRISKNYFILSVLQRESKDLTDAVVNNKLAIEKVDDDNTIMPANLRPMAKAKYTYELARTYQSAGVSAGVLPLIQSAVSQDPSLKANLQFDVNTNGFFASLSSDQEFQALLK